MNYAPFTCFSRYPLLITFPLISRAESEVSAFTLPLFFKLSAWNFSHGLAAAPASYLPCERLFPAFQLHSQSCTTPWSRPWTARQGRPSGEPRRSSGRWSAGTPPPGEPMPASWPPRGSEPAAWRPTSPPPLSLPGKDIPDKGSDGWCLDYRL